jgi:hypothetical protein
MVIERRWFMIEIRIDRYGRATIIIPGNLSPHMVQYIRNAIESARYIREHNHESIDLTGLVPDINYITTPLILNDMEVDERPNLFVQIFYTDSANSNNLVPDMVYNAMPPTSNDLVLGEEPNLSAQEPYSDPAISDASVPDIDYSITLPTLNGLGSNGELDLYH